MVARSLPRARSDHAGGHVPQRVSVHQATTRQPGLPLCQTHPKALALTKPLTAAQVSGTPRDGHSIASRLPAASAVGASCQRDAGLTRDRRVSDEMAFVPPHIP